ncbi:PREDICTED: jacalin-related lectin 44-like [Camelina sativa]|uniref:Jacalin-related lectin 44-like n=1 Tax=Camelina sativa TaxID=90675 RepID=A0ABM1QHU2_CAMSA|nr:PREDICTED: jacalin-related lectin 44-like [Camelina sativa]
MVSILEARTNCQTFETDCAELVAMFEINQLKKEYLVYVECYYNDAFQVIQGLQLKTNLNRSVMMGYKKGRKFSLASNGNRIVGFHGYADKTLNSLGAYFSTATTNKLECHGDPTGLPWDDGCNYDGVRKVYVDNLSETVYTVRFEYDNGGKVEKTPYRRDVKNEKEFVLDYPNEFITSVEGTLAAPKSANVTWITSLTFKTSKGRTSPTYGSVSSGRKFVLEKNGSALVGFYGYNGVCDTLNALGAYYCPFPPTPDAAKLEAQGGDRGASWDDGGTFNSVNKIYIGLSKNVIDFVKFMYFKSASVVIGDDHGNKTMLSDVQEFKLDPFEKITSVEGTYDDKLGGVTMLRFKTDKRDSPYFGFGSTPTFVLHKDNHQIVGFHGKSSNMLHQLGIHVLPNGFKFVF